MVDGCLQILLVEDEEGHAKLICRAFESHDRPAVVTVVPTLRAAQQRLAESTPDLVIADLCLPDSEGLELLHGDNGDRAYPVVVLTAHGDEQIAVKAMKAGALDYIVKSPASMEEMPHFAERAVREWQHITKCRLAERKFQEMIEAAPDGIVVADSDGTIRVVNQRTTELFGYTRDGLVGQPLTILVPEPYRAAHLRRYAEFFRDPERRLISSGLDLVGRRRDGSLIPLEILLAPLGSEDNLAVIATVRDVTKRKEAEERLRTTTEELSVLLESLPVVAYRCRPNGGFGTTFISENVVDLTGFSATDFTSDSAFRADRIHPEDARRVFEGMSAMFDDGFLEHEYRWKVRDGTYRWFQDNMNVIKGADGTAAYLVGAWRDITERRQAEDALKAQEKRWRDIIDSMSTFVGILTTDGVLVEANRAPLALAGLQREEVLGKPFWETYWWSYSADVQNQLREALRRAAQGETVRYDVPVRMAKGELMTIDVTFAPLYDGDGNIVELIGSAVDVTDRKNAELALRETNERLQETLQDLWQTQSHLVRQERLRAVGELTAGVCHDLNNTLSPILGYAELLVGRSDLPAEAHDFARFINVAAHDAADVVSRLRESYRLKDSLDVGQSVDLGELLQEVADLTRTKWRDEAHKRGQVIELRWELEETSPVFGNPAQLREAFTNLIFNAVDAMPSGGSVTLRLRNAPEAVVVEVADTGIGMAEDVRNRCLEPFFTTKDREGTGLGLSVCHGIVERHGGRIEVDSCLGQGTTVRIHLPPATESHRDQTEQAEDVLPSRRVLFIDDDPRLRTLVSRMLTQLGQRVETANGGQAGLSMVQSNAYDLVIIDQGMPGMDGLEVTRHIKSGHPELPVVMLTGWGPEAMAPSPKAGAAPDDIMSKPVTLPVLRAVLAKVIR